MGNKQSATREPSNRPMAAFRPWDDPKEGKTMNLLNSLDFLAGYYIFTEPFQGLKKLSDKQYCDRLIVLTAKVIKDNFSERDVTFLHERINQEGVPQFVPTSEKLIYLRAPVGIRKVEKPGDRSRRYDYTDIHYPDRSMYGGALDSDSLSRSPWDQRYLDSYGSKPRREDSNTTKKRPDAAKVSKLGQLDVQNASKKLRMCKGIAKFYIKIAHLFAAIVKTINPIYSYTDNVGKTYEYPLMQKKKLPKGVKVSVSMRNICSARLKALDTPQGEGEAGDGNIVVGVKNCNLNRKVKKGSFAKTPDTPASWNKETVSTKTLGDEPGIPELEKLYYDVYNYQTATFDRMSEGSRAAYDGDLKIFYRTFTGKSNFEAWSGEILERKRQAGETDPHVTFGDIQLVDYHNQKICKEDDSPWKQTYTGTASQGLFKNYAANLVKMLKTVHANETKLLDVLRDMFVWSMSSATGVGETNESNAGHVAINPKLTAENLQKLVDKTREIIIGMYLTCERDYQVGLQLFEAIIGDNILKTSIRKKDNLEKELDSIVVSGGDDAEVQQIIRDNISRTAQTATAKPTQVPEGPREPEPSPFSNQRQQQPIVSPPNAPNPQNIP